MNTKYKILALKYRPNKFTEIIGQDIAVKTITNAIVSNRISNVKPLAELTNLNSSYQGLLTNSIEIDRLNGIKAESLIPVFPSLTFPNHYSNATGCYSETHKYTGNNFYSKEFGEKYSYRRGAKAVAGVERKS